MKKREGLRKIITLVLAMVCVVSCTSLLFTGLSFKGFAQTSENANFIGYTCSGSHVVKSLTEQIEGLKKTDSYLFENYEEGKPVPQNPPTSAPNTTADNYLRKHFG